MKGRWLIVLLGLLVAAAISMTALAGNGSNYTYKLNEADKVLARTVVLHRADLPPPSGWRGGPVKADRSPPPVCPNFHPKLSDLVVTGDARQVWRRTMGHRYLALDSGSQVFQTALMLLHDWKRGVVAPAAVSCARSLVVKEVSTGTKRLSFKLLSFERIRFHHIARMRLLFERS